MKATLEFTLPMEEIEFNHAHKATEAHYVIAELRSLLKTWCNEGHKFTSADEAVGEVMNQLQTLCADNDVKFDE